MQDDNSVRQLQDFVKFVGHKEHGLAGVSLLQQLAVNVFDGPDVQAPGWLEGNDQVSVPVKFPGDDGLLLVTTGQVAGWQLFAGRADVELLDQFPGVLPDGLFVHDPVLGVRLLVVGLAGNVFRQRQLQDQAVLLPVGRDVADAGFRDLADWLVGQILAVDDDLAAFNMAQASDGFDQFVQPYEHSYNTSKSQYMATISWSASQLYKLTGKPSYADIAAEYIRYTLDCQRTEPLKDKDGTRGFFYRDKSRKSIVHYIHQSREQVYMQAMVMLCETQKEHPDYPKWVNSIQLYGEYLKGMMKYTHPYGMIPSGVYHAEEYKDTTNFYALHLFPPANAKELYTEQIKRGVQLDKEHYMKRFPVWFNIFNGNTAIHLSNGKSAAICGNFLKDKELLNIGLEQLYWTVGKNPFGQSLIYGEGHNYPQLNTFSSGEMTGEMPVGIRTLGNDDVPYWPQTNNACYKEVWVTSAGKWLSLTAEY